MFDRNIETQDTDVKVPGSSAVNPQEAMATVDYVCAQLAERYDLFSNGQPRRATIIEVLAKSYCPACIHRQLLSKTYHRIDAFYGELHKLAVDILVEELYQTLISKGHSVIITEEKDVPFGKVDVLLIPTSFGLNLHSKSAEIGIEVKGGFSVSITQLLRYMLDNQSRLLILWRIRNRQVISFYGKEIEDLLQLFVKMIIERADRLLSTNEPTCEHNILNRGWSPNQDQIKETFYDFSKGVVATMPEVINRVLLALDGEVKL